MARGRCYESTFIYTGVELPSLNITANMLDFFAIFSKGGFVLWCYTFQGVKTSFTEPINAFIKSVILQVDFYMLCF